MSETSDRPGAPALEGVMDCPPGSHGGGFGTVDERARRLSHAELAMADLLAGEGHRVVSLDERSGRGPIPDLEVCGRPVEVKSFLALPDRQGRAPTGRSVCNKLLGARAQAPTVILNGRTSGLTENAARDGVAEFAARGRVGRVRGVRVVGDGFDLSWSMRLVREVGITAVPAPSSDRRLPPGDALPERGRSTRRLQPPHGELGL